MDGHHSRVWSTAWFTAAARLTAVGVITGALTAAAMVLIVTALEGGVLREVASFLLFAVAVGGACGLPVALVCAASGLVATVLAPQQRAVTLGLILVWPTALSAAVVGFVIDYSSYGLWASALLTIASCGLVSACVLSTHRWVTAPLRRTPRSGQPSSRASTAR